MKKSIVVACMALALVSAGFAKSKKKQKMQILLSLVSGLKILSLLILQCTSSM